MAKSAQAFRTIREVADWLDVAAHVLRFWESKFSQIKPVKRAGGRRYYRPADMELVGGIKVLLHDRGMTIRGVQKLISDEGLDAVCALSPPIDGLLDNPNVVQLDPAEAWDVDAEAETAEAEPPSDADEAEPAQVDVEAEKDDQETEPAPEEEELPLDAAEDDADDDVDDGPEADAAIPEVEPDTPTDLLPAIAARSPHPEGPLGILAACATLPDPRRASLAPHIAALAQLRDRMRDGLDARAS